MRIIGWGRVVAGLAVVLVAGFAVGQKAGSAQQAVAVAPVPGKIYTAKKVFISNGGSDSGMFERLFFNGDPDRTYNEFFADVQGMGQYQLVGDPAQADLVLEIRLAMPSGPQLPMFRLVIYDASTHYILWALTESINYAATQKNHDKNFDLALVNLTQDLKRVGTPISARQ